ncbi:uncharacterized protein LOC129579908 [Sitodiplosis mosellana]|uniref:uncharacterized protein LOC129579908 n=1 Tax=Sitodiplosis mosellana TaxID=263140 RepID=UPI002444C392|nr:uncharacterized protein LOC129579908 [Sitodiplosis mosellana]
MSHFVKDLHLHTGLEYYTHQIRYNVQDKQTDKKDIFNDNTYQWHPELSKHGNSTYYVEEDKLNIRAQILKKNWNREDEPASGSVVLATNIKIIDHFLSDKKSKHPFQSKRTYYVILIYREPLIEDDNWDRLASRILAKLWKVHGILNAIVLATCRQNSVGIFDPFANTRHLNITDPNVDEWGIYRSFPMKYLDHTDNWLVQKDYSLNSFPLTVSIFNRRPTMVREIPKYFAQTHYAQGMKMSGYGGIDGFLLGSLSKEMNFTLNAIMPKDNYTYGYKVGGEFTGALGDILYGRADVAFNGRFLINYGTTDIEYMSPTHGDESCVVMPAARKPPQWKTFFKCFDVYFWSIFFVITSGSSIIFPILKHHQEKLERRVLRESLLYRDFKSFVVEEEIRVKDIIFVTWQVMIGMNAALPLQTIERLLIGVCLLANIIIGGSFASSLYTAYTKTTNVNIDTLSELDSTGLRIITSTPSLLNTFESWQTNSTVLQSLKDKLFLEYSEISALDRVAEIRDVCSIERYPDVLIKLKVVLTYASLP